jgi:hypothetical protein
MKTNNAPKLRDMGPQAQLKHLRACFRYDKETGKLFWREHRPLEHFKGEHRSKAWHTKYAGREIGYLQKVTGYLIVGLQGSMYRVHRVIAVLEGLLTSLNDKLSIDHIDGSKVNNKLSNLRAVTQQINLKNQKMNKNNTTGVAGVCWDKRRGRYLARASRTVDGKRERVYLGYFKDLSEASEAISNWRASEGGYTERHGK